MRKHIRHLLACLLLLSASFFPSTALSSPVAKSKARAQLKLAEAAWKTGDFQAVVQTADRGLKFHYLADLTFWKARALWSLGAHEHAWQMMNAFSPSDLLPRNHGAFAAEYERMEREVKRERADGKRVAAMRDSLVKHRVRKKKQGAMSSIFWVGATAGIALGSALVAYGVISHGDAQNDDSRFSALLYSSAGALLAGGGAGFAIAALVISPSGPVMTAGLTPAAPAVVPGLVFQTPF